MTDRQKRGIIFMIAGAVLVILALSLFIWNQQDSQRAGKEASDILRKLQKTESDRTPDSESDSGGDTEQERLPDPYADEMDTAAVDGRFYIGTIAIPALELELPVMEEWSYDRLQIAPCRYSGSVNMGDLVIAAHNYSSHFGRLSELSPGDQILFTDIYGITTAYRVENMQVLAPTEIEKMISGEYDLTLFTCTYGGRSRYTVRCKRLWLGQGDGSCVRETPDTRTGPLSPLSFPASGCPAWQNPSRACHRKSDFL